MPAIGEQVHGVARTGGPAGQSRAASGQRQVIMLTIGLGVVANVLRSPRFRELVIVGVIGLAAVARPSRENQARTLARVAAWDKNGTCPTSAHPRPGQPRAQDFHVAGNRNLGAIQRLPPLDRVAKDRPS